MPGSVSIKKMKASREKNEGGSLKTFIQPTYIFFSSLMNFIRFRMTDSIKLNQRYDILMGNFQPDQDGNVY